MGGRRGLPATACLTVAKHAEPPSPTDAPAANVGGLWHFPGMGKEGRRQGSVDRSRVKHVKQHELDTAHRLAELGEDVTFIPVGRSPRPDVELSSGGRWDLKSPVSDKRNTIMGKISDAAADGKANVVLDLTRTSVVIDEALNLARESVRIYAGLQAIRLIGRDTPDGPLDITVRR
jgi:hypothetical protein